VSGLDSGVLAIAVGTHRSCARMWSGELWCWGYNGDGLLGDGTTGDRLVPVQIVGLGSGVVSVTLGLFHSCVVTSVGEALCWGKNDNGQLGDVSTVDRPIPTPVYGLSSGVVAVAAGDSHTCVLKSTGGVACWGDNSVGQVGDDTYASKRYVPTPVKNLDSGVIAMSVGSGHTCVLTTVGGALCWGFNSRGQLGVENPGEKRVPTQVVGMESGVLAISAGGGHTCASTSGKDAWCWGFNNRGQLGNGTVVDSWVPSRVAGLP